jgi:hypothetical protein
VRENKLLGVLVIFVAGAMVASLYIGFSTPERVPDPKPISDGDATLVAQAYFRSNLEASNMSLKKTQLIGYAYDDKNDEAWVTVKIFDADNRSAEFLVKLTNGWHVNGIPAPIRNG